MAMIVSTATAPTMLLPKYLESDHASTALNPIVMFITRSPVSTAHLSPPHICTAPVSCTLTIKSRTVGCCINATAEPRSSKLTMRTHFASATSQTSNTKSFSHAMNTTPSEPSLALCSIHDTLLDFLRIESGSGKLGRWVADAATTSRATLNSPAESFVLATTRNSTTVPSVQPIHARVPSIGAIAVTDSLRATTTICEFINRPISQSHAMTPPFFKPAHNNGDPFGAFTIVTMDDFKNAELVPPLGRAMHDVPPVASTRGLSIRRRPRMNMSYASSLGNAPPVDHQSSAPSDPAAHIVSTPEPKILSIVCATPPRSSRRRPSLDTPATPNLPDAPAMFHSCSSRASKSRVTSSNFPSVFPPIAYRTSFCAVVNDP
mmetsp:Transcript_8576/g.33992  ORF Transcript_8576/g.33992 Transcript_8576/m.33992 type:complete len:376 (+) Transcript_8576:2131-3258(+)